MPGVQFCAGQYDSSPASHFPLPQVAATEDREDLDEELLLSPSFALIAAS